MSYCTKHPLAALPRRLYLLMSNTRAIHFLKRCEGGPRVFVYGTRRPTLLIRHDLWNHGNWGGGYPLPQNFLMGFVKISQVTGRDWGAVMGKSQSWLGFKSRFEHIIAIRFEVQRFKRSRFYFRFDFEYLRFDSKRIQIAANQLLSYWRPTKWTNHRSTSSLDTI